MMMMTKLRRAVRRAVRLATHLTAMMGLRAIYRYYIHACSMNIFIFQKQKNNTHAQNAATVYIVAVKEIFVLLLLR